MKRLKQGKPTLDLFITITLDESDIALLAYIKEMGYTLYIYILNILLIYKVASIHTEKKKKR